MTTEKLTNLLLNSNPKDLQSMTSEDLKELREFLDTKSTEITWILKGRAKSKSHFSNSK